ncbi:hypothetical protein SMF913_27104 [Streptomyces malaysiensis]|uniref:Uncharacterized protein n=1 Tax=Streptomyces malaysiensis TaxID=92644 RepID=A0A2J7YUS0_STRMQ|nr:hypothetical protein SMF913_27104 [Streptomyces malaysiensis]
MPAGEWEWEVAALGLAPAPLAAMREALAAR